MSEEEEIILFGKIRDNIRKAQRSLLERKAKLGEHVVIADENGQPLIVPAQAALERFKERK